MLYYWIDFTNFKHQVDAHYSDMLSMKQWINQRYYFEDANTNFNKILNKIRD